MPFSSSNVPFDVSFDASRHTRDIKVPHVLLIIF